MVQQRSNAIARTDEDGIETKIFCGFRVHLGKSSYAGGSQEIKRWSVDPVIMASGCGYFLFSLTGQNPVDARPTNSEARGDLGRVTSRPL
jgi:hypothetical protein